MRKPGIISIISMHTRTDHHIASCRQHKTCDTLHNCARRFLHNSTPIRPFCVSGHTSRSNGSVVRSSDKCTRQPKRRLVLGFICFFLENDTSPTQAHDVGQIHVLYGMYRNAYARACFVLALQCCRRFGVSCSECVCCEWSRFCVCVCVSNRRAMHRVNERTNAIYILAMALGWLAGVLLAGILLKRR